MLFQKISNFLSETETETETPLPVSLEIPAFVRTLLLKVLLLTPVLPFGIFNNLPRVGIKHYQEPHVCNLYSDRM